MHEGETHDDVSKDKKRGTLGMLPTIVLMLVASVMAVSAYHYAQGKETAISQFTKYLHEGGHSSEMIPISSERGSYYTPFAHDQPWAVLMLDGRDAARVLYLAPDKAQGLFEAQDEQTRGRTIVRDGLIVFYHGELDSPVFALLKGYGSGPI